MKKIGIIIGLSAAMGSAHAGPTWVESSFWRAPFIADQALKVEAVTKDLAETCEDYRDSLLIKDGKTPLGASNVDLLRKNDPSSGRDFVAIFKVNKSQSEELLQKSIEKANQLTKISAMIDPLPLFVQPVSEATLAIDPESEITVALDATKPSLSRISVSVGLKPLPIAFNSKNPTTVFNVQGKDVACDLIEGNVKLKFQSSSRVYISDDAMGILENFYRDFEKMTKSVVDKKKSPLAKAAILGKELGTSLSKISAKNEDVEWMIENIVGRFFNEKMERSKVWETFNNEQILNVPGSVLTNVNVLVEK